MKYILILVFTMISSVVAAQGAATYNWTGTWSSNFGDLRLVQSGQKITGGYASVGTITGTVDAGCTLTGEFDNTRKGGKGTYIFSRNNNRFDGSWRWNGSSSESKWNGWLKSSAKPKLINQQLTDAACNWSGTWSSTSGDVVLSQNGSVVTSTQGKAGVVSGAAAVNCGLGGETRLKGRIEDKTAGGIRESTITKTGRRFAGTWSIAGGAGVPRSYPWGGTLRSLDGPVGAKAEVENIVEGTANTDAVSTDPKTPVKDKPTKGISQVTIGPICVVSKEENNGGLLTLASAGPQIYGIGWVKARVVDKRSGNVIELPPRSEFPNLNSDKERVWERRSADYVNSTACELRSIS